MISKTISVEMRKHIKIMRHCQSKVKALAPTLARHLTRAPVEGH